ncbi:MAG: hypothetical protein OXF41_08075 [bacterium]|nr:hypothetical protein [bacterium]
MGRQRPPLFPERTYTFIGADGTVYGRSGRIITPAPGRPVDVPDPERDPDGHRQDLELAALTRRIRDETGAGGEEAYESACRGMLGLGLDDPVPGLWEVAPASGRPAVRRVPVGMGRGCGHQT